MNEFEIIERYFRAGPLGNDVVVGPGDDCAVLEVPLNEALLATTDTLVEGVHFPQQSPPDKLGYRTCATALSDIAAMGGQARWASLALTVPAFEDDWFESFVAGFQRALAIDDTSLTGGDLTHGPLSITWHITGTAEKNSVLLRSAAQLNDEIYVTGSLGAAAYALQFLGQQSKHPSLDRYWFPTPRLRVARKLAPMLTSCIDISDGLLADLSHILRASKKAAILDPGAIPAHHSLNELRSSARLRFLLDGGDDYELCFTANPADSKKLQEMSDQFNLAITSIGTIVEDEETLIRTLEGRPLTAEGYRHFQ